MHFLPEHELVGEKFVHTMRQSFSDRGRDEASTNASGEDRYSGKNDCCDGQRSEDPIGQKVSVIRTRESEKATQGPRSTVKKPEAKQGWVDRRGDKARGRI